MKIVTIVLFVAGLVAAGFWYITENSRADRVLAYQRQQKQIEKAEAIEKERAERQREEDERIRKERAEAVAKEDAMRMFLSYIDREEVRLKEEVEEAEIGLQKIDVDQSSLEEELQAIERANEARVASKDKRGESQRDMVERVRAMLKSVVLNRLSRTYCGFDLSALRSEFESEMQKIKDIDDHYHKRNKAIRQKYEESVKDVDKEVDKKMKVAREKYASVQKQIDPNRLEKLRKQLTDIEQKIEKNLRKSLARTKWDERDLTQLQQQQIILQNQISSYADVSGLASAGTLHMDVTEAETSARRKYNRAQEIRDDERDAAQEERDYEQDVYARVSRYEDKSLGMIRVVMINARNQKFGALNLAKKHLSFIKQKAVNLDLLTADEIEAMRKEIARSISKSIIEVEVGK